MSHRRKSSAGGANISAVNFTGFPKNAWSFLPPHTDDGERFPVTTVRAREAAWIAMLLAAYIVVAYAAYLPRAVFHDDAQSAAGLALAIAGRETLVLAVVVVGARRYLGMTLRDLGVVRPSLRDVGIGVVVGLGLVMLSVCLVHLIHERRASVVLGALVSGGGLAQAAAFAGIALWSPFVQEVVFRGAFLRSFRERLPASYSVVITALLFGAVHLAADWSTVIATTIAGLVQGAITVRRGTLTAAIASHVTVNTFSCAYAVLSFKIAHHPG